MAIDLKYGQITTELGSIGDAEPVVIFRAKDKLLLKVLAYYHLFCLKEGSPKKHLDMILDAREKIKTWQNKNHTKIPD